MRQSRRCARLGYATNSCSFATSQSATSIRSASRAIQARSRPSFRLPMGWKCSRRSWRTRNPCSVAEKGNSTRYSSNCTGAFTRPGCIGGWHTDITLVPNPTSTTFLRGIKIPARGGDTLQVDLEALCGSFSRSLQAFLGTLNAVHAREDARGGHTPRLRHDGHSTGPFLSEHSLVRV